MRLFRLTSRGAAALILAPVAHAQLIEVGGECSADAVCETGCCGTEMVRPVCIDKLTQGAGEECVTLDGCDCAVGLCTDGFCPSGTPRLPQRACVMDIDCLSGCCASQLEDPICIPKATQASGESCDTDDGCDCIVGNCINGLCPVAAAPDTPVSTPGPQPVLLTPPPFTEPPTVTGCLADDDCPENGVCCQDLTCAQDLQSCDAAPPPTTAPAPPIPVELTDPSIPAPGCPPGINICDDPHMKGLRGQTIDWFGVDGGWYCLVTENDADLHINVRLTAPLPEEFPHRQLITGFSIISQGHSLTIEVINPYDVHADGCPSGISPCLVDGGLRVNVDERQDDGVLRFLRNAYVADDIVVSASNLPVECRQFGGDKLWVQMYDEMLQGGRELALEATFEEWILSSDHMAAHGWCSQYIDQHDLADLQSNHAIFKIVTSAVTVRLIVGTNVQGNGERDWDGRVLPDMEIWQMDVGLHGLSLQSQSLSGILGETAHPVVDNDGRTVMQGYDAFRGTVEDYRVSGSLGTEFALLKKQ